MTTFTEYATKYQHIRMERRDGILQLTLHSDGKILRWGAPHEELGFAFRDIGSDPENRVIVLTGTGQAFIEEVDSGNVGQRLPATKITPQVWDHRPQRTCDRWRAQDHPTGVGSHLLGRETTLDESPRY